MTTLRTTSVPGLLQCQFYAHTEIPNPMRSVFELPGDPFDDDPEIARVGKDYLYKLSVFFYRDELHDRGIIVDKSFADKNGFPAWLYSAVLDSNDLKIGGWDKPTLEITEKNGDDRAWLSWSEPRNILSIDEYVVKTS